MFLTSPDSASCYSKHRETSSHISKHCFRVKGCVSRDDVFAGSVVHMYHLLMHFHRDFHTSQITMIVDLSEVCIAGLRCSYAVLVLKIEAVSERGSGAAKPQLYTSLADFLKFEKILQSQYRSH